MPNWCSTSVKIVGEEESLDKILAILDDMQNREDPKTSDFGRMWLGELVKKLGGDIEKVYCRGWIDYYESNGEEISLYYESAWAPMFDVHDLIREKFPDVAIYYQAEEPGMIIYQTNSFDYFPDRYYLYVEDGYTEYFEDIDDLIAAIKDITGKKELKTLADGKAAMEDYSEEHSNLGYSLHEFELVED